MTSSTVTVKAQVPSSEGWPRSLAFTITRSSFSWSGASRLNFCSQRITTMVTLHGGNLTFLAVLANDSVQSQFWWESQISLLLELRRHDKANLLKLQLYEPTLTPQMRFQTQVCSLAIKVQGSAYLSLATHSTRGEVTRQLVDVEERIR